jgi:glyoxylase-like metal-dependent hydrolase (beta-lactamase superfamily II)
VPAHDHLRVEIGLSNGWIIRSDRGAVLVDAGFDRFAPRVAWGLRHMGLRPRDLKLVIITHAHIDHIGALGDIVRGTGAAVAVHEREAGHVRRGEPLMPLGLSLRGRLTVAFGNRHPELTAVKPVAPEVVNLVINSFRPVLPLRTSCFGDSPGDMPLSWRKVLDLGARVICPGHGLAFPAGRLAELLAITSERRG